MRRTSRFVKNMALAFPRPRTYRNKRYGTKRSTSKLRRQISSSVPCAMFLYYHRPGSLRRRQRRRPRRRRCCSTRPNHRPRRLRRFHSRRWYDDNCVGVGGDDDDDEKKIVTERDIDEAVRQMQMENGGMDGREHDDLENEGISRQHIRRVLERKFEKTASLSFRRCAPRGNQNQTKSSANLRSRPFPLRHLAQTRLRL